MVERRRLPLAWVLLGLVGATGCGAPPEPTPPPTSTTQRAPSLFDELHAVARPEPPLSALPAQSRAKLDELLASLELEERAELQQGTHPQTTEHPLFHWAAGGHSLAAYAASVETDVLSADWSALAGTAEPPLSQRQLVDVANELARRAAQHLLRERAADFTPGRTPSVEAFRQVTDAAELLEMRELARHVTVAWSAADPGVDAQWAAFRSSVRELDLSDAERRLDVVRRLDAPGKVTLGELDLAAARLLATPEGTPVERARAFTRLGRFGDALATLDGRASGLAETTERMRAELGASVCPKVLRPHESLCAAAFALESSRLDLQARLLEAWRGKSGRDEVATEHFLGIAFVWQLMTLRAPDGSPLRRQDFGSTLDALREHAEEASAEFPRFFAISLIAESLGQAFAATEQMGEGGRAQIPAERRAAFRQRSLAAAASGAHEWFDAAALTALALSLQDDPLGNELAQLQVEGGEALATLGSLELWTALADRDEQRLRRLDELLVSIAQQTDERTRAGWLLAYAEASVLLEPSDATRGTLLRLAEPLLGEVPLDLRLRAVLDTAGVWARSGREDDARALLTRTKSAVPLGRVDSETARDLWVLVSGYEQVLASRSPVGLGPALDELEALRASLSSPFGASPSVVAWVEAWQAELGKRARLSSCTTRECRRREQETMRALWAKLERRLGQRTRALFEAGVAPLGGAQIDLRYDPHQGLKPRVAVEVAFPLAEVPAPEAEVSR